MDNEKVTKGIKVFGVVLMVFCALGLGWSFCHPVTSGPTLDQLHEINQK